LRPEGVFPYDERKQTEIASQNDDQLGEFFNTNWLNAYESKKELKAHQSFLFWLLLVRKYGSPWANGFDAEIFACAPKAYFHTARGSKRK